MAQCLVCRACGKDLAKTAKILGLSRDAVKEFHEGVHLGEVLRETLDAIDRLAKNKKDDPVLLLEAIRDVLERYQNYRFPGWIENSRQRAVCSRQP